MNTLDRICADKRVHLQRKMAQTPLALLEKKIEEQSLPRGFIKALKNKTRAVIAEVKKASPSKGIIRADFDAPAIARLYQESGAACLSVLTDEPYFQGHDDYLAAIRSAVTLPLLRKDFMIDAYQIYESRALGADCILLIMAALDDSSAQAFYTLSDRLGMDVLIEVHDADELDRALMLDIDPRRAMIGVNNRNLKTLAVDKATGMTLAEKIPPHFTRVAESGIETAADIAAFEKAGYGAFLIGESLMRQTDIGDALKKLLEQS